MESNMSDFKGTYNDGHGQVHFRGPSLVDTTGGSTHIPAENDTIKKDSREAWIVCFAAFLLQVLIVGVLHVFGYFFVALLQEFQCTKGETAWIGSVAYGLSMAFGPVTSTVVNRFGNHVSVMVGSLICGISLIVSSMVNSIGAMFVTFSILYGIGMSLAYTPTMTIASDYFDKYMALATGLMVSGSSTGTLVLSPLTQQLISGMGWRNTMRIFTCFSLVGVACGYTFRHSKKKKTVREHLSCTPAGGLMKELHLWKDKVYIIWVCSICLAMFGYYIPYVHLVAYAMDVGISEQNASVIIMVMGGSTAIGRIMFGKIVEFGYLNRLHMHQLSLVVTGMMSMMLPLMRSTGALVGYVICVGLVDGCVVVLLPVLTTTLVGVEKKVLAWGYLVGFSSITFTLGPPIAGWMYDRSGSYDTAFHIAGIPIILAAIVMFFIPWAQRTAQSTTILAESAPTQAYDAMTSSVMSSDALMPELLDQDTIDLKLFSIEDQPGHMKAIDIPAPESDKITIRSRSSYLVVDLENYTVRGSVDNSSDFGNKLVEAMNMLIQDNPPATPVSSFHGPESVVSGDVTVDRLINLDVLSPRPGMSRHPSNVIQRPRPSSRSNSSTSQNYSTYQNLTLSENELRFPIQVSQNGLRHSAHAVPQGFALAMGPLGQQGNSSSTGHTQRVRSTSLSSDTVAQTHMATSPPHFSIQSMPTSPLPSSPVESPHDSFVYLGDPLNSDPNIVQQQHPGQLPPLLEEASVASFLQPEVRTDGAASLVQRGATTLSPTTSTGTITPGQQTSVHDIDAIFEMSDINNESNHDS